MHAGCPCLQPVKEYVKPHNQLRLSDAELEEELACSLTAGNPAAPSNIARYYLKDSTYKVCCCNTYQDSTLWLHSLWQWGQKGADSPAVPHIWLIQKLQTKCHQYCCTVGVNKTAWYMSTS